MTTNIKNFNINSDEIKNRILKYLYTNGINTEVRYANVSSEKDLDVIKNNDYIICPRYVGTRSWVILFNVGINYYAVNFPKHGQHKRTDIVIHPIEMAFGKAFYQGTIMEGIYYRNDNNKHIIIDEIYTLCGENQIFKPKEDRLGTLKLHFKKNVASSPNFSMTVVNHYEINAPSLKDLHEKIKNNPNVQEIIFYPKKYGDKIYSYTILDSDLMDNIIETSCFYLEKTSSPDVYNLLATKTKNKIDIAYVPTLEASIRCKSWFKNKKIKEILVKCQYDYSFKKWIPMEIIEEDVR